MNHSIPRMSFPDEKERFQKIIVFCLAGIGDTLMCTPTLGILKQEFPAAKIDVLVMHEGAKNILECSPDVNRVIQWNFMKHGFFKSLKFCLKLRQKKYDVSLMSYPSNRDEYNMVSLLIGAKVRVGHQYNVKCTYGTNVMAFNRRLKESGENKRHNVEENIELLKCLNITPKSDADYRLRLHLSREDIEFAKAFLRRYRDIESPLLVGIHPGSGETKNLHFRRWPISHFAHLSDLLMLSKRAQILVFGGPNEKHLRSDLQRFMTQKPILVENVSFRRTGALIQQCDLFISVDVGLMHTAAAVGTPTVALYGPTDPHLTFPWANRHQIVYRNFACSPCYFYSNMQLSCPAKRNFECINSISVADVIENIETLLPDENRSFNEKGSNSSLKKNRADANCVQKQYI